MKFDDLSPLRQAGRLSLTLAALVTFALPTRAQEGVPADEALALLKGGNERFVAGRMRAKDFLRARPELAKGQHPYAIVLACADSRVAPELVFDESLGQLFVVRVAGNVADPVVLGSIEYAVEHLHTNLLVVLGHESCGAVKATISGGEAPPNIAALLKRIFPAVHKVRTQNLGEQALLTEAIKENVRYQMQLSLFESEVLSHFVREKKLKVVGGVYGLQTGKVEMIPSELVVERDIEGRGADRQAAASGAGSHRPPAMVDAQHEVKPAGDHREAGPAGAPREDRAAGADHEVKKEAPARTKTDHHPAPGMPDHRQEPKAHPTSAAAPEFGKLVQAAYRGHYDVVLKKSLQMRDEHNRCSPFDCRNIPAGETVKVLAPVVLKVEGKPQIKVQYKGKPCFVSADVQDFAFASRVSKK